MPAKKKRKWYTSPLILTVISLIGGAILSFIPAYYFKIREQRIEYSKIENSIINAENLLSQGLPDEALGKYQLLITTVSRQLKPEFYARIKRGEGLAYFTLSYSNEKENNLKKALSSFYDALEIYTIEKYPEDYARTQGYIANTCLAMSEIRDREKNLNLAILSNEEALKVYNREKYPVQYGKIKLNLGINYEYLAEINYKEEYLKQAVDYYNEALEIFSIEKYPVENATIKLNLANSYMGFSESKKILVT